MHLLTTKENPVLTIKHIIKKIEEVNTKIAIR